MVRFPADVDDLVRHDDLLAVVVNGEARQALQQLPDTVFVLRTLQEGPLWCPPREDLFSSECPQDAVEVDAGQVYVDDDLEVLGAAAAEEAEAKAATGLGLIAKAFRLFLTSLPAPDYFFWVPRGSRPPSLHGTARSTREATGHGRN